MSSSTTPIWSYRTSPDSAGGTIIALTGELDLHGADALRTLLRNLLDTAVTHRVVADLDAVTFFDSAALGAVINAYQHAVDCGGQFAVINLTHTVRRILEITGMLEILTSGATPSHL